MRVRVFRGASRTHRGGAGEVGRGSQSPRGCLAGPTPEAERQQINKERYFPSAERGAGPESQLAAAAAAALSPALARKAPSPGKFATPSPRQLAGSAASPPHPSHQSPPPIAGSPPPRLAFFPRQPGEGGPTSGLELKSGWCAPPGARPGLPPQRPRRRAHSSPAPWTRWNRRHQPGRAQRPPAAPERSARAGAAPRAPAGPKVEGRLPEGERGVEGGGQR